MLSLQEIQIKRRAIAEKDEELRAAFVEIEALRRKAQKKMPVFFAASSIVKFKSFGFAHQG